MHHNSEIQIATEEGSVH